MTRRTVSPYCRRESWLPDQLVRLASTGWAGSETSRSMSWLPPVERWIGPPSGPSIVRFRRHRLVAGDQHVVAHQQQAVGVPTGGQAPLGELGAAQPVTSVITIRRWSWSRTTSRPSVLATSGSSTPASWRLVPVGPLATSALAGARSPRPGQLEAVADAQHLSSPGRPSRRGRPGRSCASTYHGCSASQSWKVVSPAAARAGGAPGSATTPAVTPTATRPPIASVEMRLPPRAVFAGVPCCCDAVMDGTVPDVPG